MVAPPSTPHLAWVLALLLVGTGWGDMVAQSDSSVSSTPLRPPNRVVPAPSFNAGESSRAKRIFFPPDPPPLGAQINIDPHRSQPGRVPRELGAFVHESFYPPLSTYLADSSPQSQRKYRPRVDAYRTTRDRLLGELRAVVKAQVGATPDERAQEYAASVARQATALVALENEAEALRTVLADRVSWFDLREWKLGAGPLRLRLPEHAYLEFQVVRAAAYYQPGFLPAQRRLLREAAMAMQDQVFADAADEFAAPVESTVPLLAFFSPDLVRLLPVADMPPDVKAQFDAWVSAKDTLRDELVAAVLVHDKAKFLSSRRRVMESLAKAQTAGLMALEERAEEIRRAYAPTWSRRRGSPPYELPADVAGAIDKCLEQRGVLLGMLEGRIQVARNRAAAEYRGRDRAELREVQLQEMQATIETFTREYRDRLSALEDELERVHGLLVACVGEAALSARGRTADAFLVEYIARYRQEWAAYEYDIAVFEPGLSPAQRRLLIGGAVRRFALPLPGAERQPTALPLTLLTDEMLK